MYSVCVCHKITEVSLQERSRNNSHCTYSHVKVHGISLEAKIGYRCVICGRVVFGVRLDCFSFSRCRNTRCSQLNWGAVQLWEVEVMLKLADAPTSEFWDTLTLRCWSQTWCSRVWAPTRGTCCAATLSQGVAANWICSENMFLARSCCPRSPHLIAKVITGSGACRREAPCSAVQRSEARALEPKYCPRKKKKKLEGRGEARSQFEVR